MRRTCTVVDLRTWSSPEARRLTKNHVLRKACAELTVVPVTGRDAGSDTVKVEPRFSPEAQTDPASPHPLSSCLNLQRNFAAGLDWHQLIMLSDDCHCWKIERVCAKLGAAFFPRCKTTKTMCSAFSRTEDSLAASKSMALARV